MRKSSHVNRDGDGGGGGVAAAGRTGALRWGMGWKQARACPPPRPSGREDGETNFMSLYGSPEPCAVREL